MALYTRTGDDGTTGLPAPEGAPKVRIRKDDPRTMALGGVDELNAHVGLCLAEAVRINHLFIREALQVAQRDLLAVGAILAAVGAGGPPPVKLRDDAVAKMEKDIDAVCADLPELKNFIQPGGSELGARLHVARAVSRRAEGAVVAMVESLAPQAGETARPKAGPSAAAKGALVYLNRLSDLLFALARLANRDSGEPDVLWTA